MAGSNGDRPARAPRRALVYVGPSLFVQDLERLRAEPFEVRPPISRGEIAGVLEEGYEVVGIVDGNFLQKLAVSPKELLAALERGLTIVGGASMGALRAAELHPYGMIGVGRIFEWFRTGRVSRDDDVGVVYSACNGGYVTHTAPMVNVLWVVRAARREGWLPAAESARIVRAARRLHWSDRTWPLVTVEARLGPELRDRLIGFAGQPEHDLKRLDAWDVVARTCLEAGIETRRS